MFKIKNFYISLFMLLAPFISENLWGQTEITKWKYDKKGAISITYDDGNINQFKKAMPIMDRLGLPGTFFIVTGAIPGSQYPAQFIGRPVQEIINETKITPTNENNFFERASAIAHSGYKGTWDFHLQAGQLFETGKIKEAYQIIDEAYEKVRTGKLEKGEDMSWEAAQSSENSWKEFKEYAARGHEFGSHTISHPRLAILDEANLLYELEKSREDILHHLGEAHVFSAECPFGTEDERVMDYAHKIFPALRNRMPAPYLEELNRWNKTSPGNSEKEYVQWQRGPLTDVPMTDMKSWVDSVVTNDNIWLVLVFHGIDGIGWQPKTTEELKVYFEYIKEKSDQAWIATFKDVSQYIRVRMNTDVSESRKQNEISIQLTHTLDPEWYNHDLTLKTYLPAAWETAQVTQNGKTQKPGINKDKKGQFILYQAIPNSGNIEIRGL